MVASDKRIKELMRMGVLVIDNLKPEAIGAASIDLHFSGEFQIMKAATIDDIEAGGGEVIPRKLSDFKNPDVFRKIEGDEAVVWPGEYCLAGTAEITRLRKTSIIGTLDNPEVAAKKRELGIEPMDYRKDISIAGIMKSRSSLARAGLIIPNAGWVDPGFEGSLTVQLFNAGTHPVILSKGDRVVQLVILEVEAPEYMYEGGYNNDGDTLGVREGAF